MTLKLYAFPLSPRSFKVLWAANHLDIPYELKVVDMPTGAQSAPDYTAINPNGRVPAMVDGDFTLWESNAIIEYLASIKPEGGLLPQDLRGRLSVCKWLFWESAHWDSACLIFAVERVVKPLFGRGEPVQAEIDRATPLFQRVGKVLDGELAKHRYVAGDRLTIADISIGSVMCIADRAGFPMESFRALQRWRADITSLTSWVKTAAMQGYPAVTT
jgi:glutathione S-transferase